MAYLNPNGLFHLDLDTEDVNGKRHYKTPEGNLYPSMTTVLSAADKGDQLVKWIAKVGEKEAERIRNDSAELGTEMHNMLEAYLREEPIPSGSFRAKERFQDIRPELDNNVGKVFAIETALYSDRLKLAGRTDLFAEYQGIPSVIDFKNARRRRKRSMISNYFMQGAGYSQMYWDMTKDVESTPRQIVILMAIAGEGLEVFVEPIKPWIEPLNKVILDYANSQLTQSETHI